MAPLSLKIVQDEGAVTRTVKFESTMRVREAQALVREKILTAHDGKDYGLFLTSADDEKSGVWLEAHRQLDYYVLRDGDQLHYMCRARNLRVRMLDGSVKTLPVDESHTVEQLMVGICGRLGITNHDEYGLCFDGDEDAEESKPAAGTGTLTLKRVTLQRERDTKLQQLSKKLKTDDHVEWLDQHRTLRELSVDPKRTVLLKRRLFFSDRNVDARDPVQLNLLYVQARDAILEGRHPVTEDQAVDCKVRWINIRDVNRRIIRKNLINPSPRNRLYKYEAELAFMKPFFKDVVTPNGDDYDDDPDDKSLWDECGGMPEPEPVDDSDDSEKPIKTLLQKSGKKKKKKRYDEEQKPVLPAVMSEASNTSDFEPTDPVDAFLLSIGATLKTFNAYHLNLAKSKIFAVVQEHDLQQIVQKSNEVKVTAPDSMFLHGMTSESGRL